MPSKKKKSDADVVDKNSATSVKQTDELIDDKAQESLPFDTLTERADAIDRVLTEDGDPEFDLTSG